MSKKILMIVLIQALWMISLSAQDHLTFNLGGGISAPLNPTGALTGVSGNFVASAGYKLDKKNSISGEFMWSGLPTDLFTIHPTDAPFGGVNLYSLTANFRHQIDRINHSPFGVYAVAGGGWYYRYATVDKNFTVPPLTVCAPVYAWWGYSCDPNGYVYSQTVAYKGVSAPGLNGGVGFTISFADSGWKFYTEARYHYAFSNRIATTLIPITFGFRYN